MKLFVTGATGFIGSHFVNQAIENGHEVVALRRPDGKAPRVPIVGCPSWLTSEMHSVNKEDFRRIDALVHLAAHSANVPYDNVENCIYWNVMVPLQLFAKARSAGVERFVIAGSCFEYGPAGERYVFIPPDAPLEATASYPASKAAASIAFRAFARESNAKLSIHRIFHVFGEGEPESRLWPTLHRAALAGDDMPMTLGEQVRDFIPVKRAAELLLSACTDTRVPAGSPLVLNLGTGVPTTTRNFAESWWSTWNAGGRLLFGEIPYRPGEIMRLVGEIEDSNMTR